MARPEGLQRWLRLLWMRVRWVHRLLVFKIRSPEEMYRNKSDSCNMFPVIEFVVECTQLEVKELVQH